MKLIVWKAIPTFCWQKQSTSSEMGLLTTWSWEVGKRGNTFLLGVQFTSICVQFIWMHEWWHSLQGCLLFSLDLAAGVTNHYLHNLLLFRNSTFSHGLLLNYSIWTQGDCDYIFLQVLDISNILMRSVSFKYSPCGHINIYAQSFLWAANRHAT